MKYLKYLVLVVIVLMLQLGLLSNIFMTYEVSIIPVATLALTLFASLEISLIASALMGFVYDVSTLQRVPFLTLFLLLEVVMVIVLKKHVLNLSNLLGRLASVFLVVFMYQGLKAVIFYRAINLELLWVLLVNFILGILIVELWHRYQKFFSI